MQRRRFHAILGSCLAAALCRPLAAAADTAGTVYEGEFDGVVTRLSWRRQGAQWVGQLGEGAMQLPVQASAEPGTTAATALLRGAVLHPQTGQPLLPFRARLTADELTLEVAAVDGQPARSLTMRRVGAGSAGPAQAAAGSGIDARLVGRWTQVGVLGGPGGAGGTAHFSVERTVALHADGHIEQWSRAAGGGAGWSAVSGPALDFSGQWRSSGGQLQVRRGGGSFETVGAYRLVGERLVVETRGQRIIWAR